MNAFFRSQNEKPSRYLRAKKNAEFVSVLCHHLGYSEQKLRDHSHFLLELHVLEWKKRIDARAFAADFDQTHLSRMLANVIPLAKGKLVNRFFGAIKFHVLRCETMFATVSQDLLRDAMVRMDLTLGTKNPIKARYVANEDIIVLQACANAMRTEFEDIPFEREIDFKHMRPALHAFLKSFCCRVLNTGSGRATLFRYATNIIMKSAKKTCI